MKKFFKLFCVTLVLIMVSLTTTGCLDRIFGPIEDEPPMDQGQDHDNDTGDNSDGDNVDSWDLIFYSVDKDTDLLVPVSVSYPKREGIAKAVTEELVLGSPLSTRIAEFGLEMPLPQRTKVLGISIRDNVARVDFSEDFLDHKDKIHEQLSVTALVYTLTQFPTIDSVQIIVNGQEIQSLLYDTYIKLPLDKDIGINTVVNDGVNLKDSVRILTYYPIKRGNNTIFLPRTKVVNKPQDLLKTAVEEYLKGPNSALISNPIPRGVNVIRVAQEDEIAVVNLSSEFTEYTSNNEKGIIDSLLLTVTEIEGIEKVQILIEGEPVVLPEGTDLGTVFTRPVPYKLK